MRRLGVLIAAVVLVGIPLEASAATQSVSIDGAPSCGASSFCYTPGTVNAKVGDKVTWTNMSQAPHTVTRCTSSACNGNGPGNGGRSGPSSPQIAPGGTFAMTFTKAGTYLYYCQIHGYGTMHATVHVAAASATPGPTAAPTAAPTSAPTAAPSAAPSATTSVAATAATPAKALPTSGRNIRPFLLLAGTLIEVGSVFVLCSSLWSVRRRRSR